MKDEQTTGTLTEQDISIVTRRGRLRMWNIRNLPWDSLTDFQALAILMLLSAEKIPVTVTYLYNNETERERGVIKAVEDGYLAPAIMCHIDGHGRYQDHHSHGPHFSLGRKFILIRDIVSIKA